MRIIIRDRNVQEELLKNDLHSVKMQLNSNINHNKLIKEEVTTLKQDFKQKENKYIEEFLDMKQLKEKKKVSIGYKNPVYLTKAKQVQHALYNGHELVKTTHAPAVVHDSEDTIEIAEKTRIGMLKKMKSTLWLIDTPEFDTVFKINKMKASLQGKDSAIRKLKEQISQMNERRKKNELFRAENEKVKQHYKKLYDSIKITRVKTIEKTTSLLTENEKLEAQLKGKMQCVTMPTVKSKVVAPGMYAIDVKPIPPRNRNNRGVHLEYLKHLKESVETVRELVEEARIEKPLDNVLENACFYTKRSQELLEYVIGICPKESNKRDKKAATTPFK
ncbi:hypothetical protein Tco_1082248 [Tanacetum coccineum]|uniref:Uncharacterized protein n=1 Tax=Tanacetum coccineum TaxID=301880 RepID=A0ABQ5I032_9ASTR